MKHLIHLDCREFTLLSGIDVGAWRHQRHNAFEARQRLARFCADHSNMAKLREVLRRELGLEPWKLSNHQVLDHLAGLMAQGKLAIVQSPSSLLSPHAPGFLRILGPKREEPKKRVRILGDSRAWIEIKLRDEEERPLANEPYVLVLEGGSRVAGTLNAKGTTRHDGIQPGTCKVSFTRWQGRIQQGEEGSPKYQDPDTSPAIFSSGTNKSHLFVAKRNDLYLRLSIDPDQDEDAVGYFFTLVGRNGAKEGEGKTFSQTRTVADDKIAGDGYLDLLYTELVPGLSYSLEVRHEEDNEMPSYTVLEQVPFEQLFSDRK